MARHASHVVYGCPELYVVQGAKNTNRAIKLCKVHGRTWIEMYYVYVLRSQIDGKHYIGYTTNLRNRMQKHNNGEVTSTRSRRPFELIFYEDFKSMKDAKRREQYFKTTKGKSS